MLRIRLSRIGATKRPFYRVVVSESARTPRARNIAIVGTYAPKSNPSEIRLDLEKIDEWIKKGAQPSNSVLRLMQAQRRSGGPTPAPAARAV